MNNENIKVSFKQVEEIIFKLRSTSDSVDTKINNYKTNLKSIVDKGYLDGVADMSISLSCDKISRLCKEFKEYANELSNKLNKVITETQQVESGAKQNLDNILSLDPTKFLTNSTAMVTGALSFAIDPTKFSQTTDIGFNPSSIITPIKSNTAEVKTETTVKTNVESNNDLKTETIVKPEPVVTPEPKPEVKPEPAVTPEPKPEVQPQTETKTTTLDNKNSLAYPGVLGSTQLKNRDTIVDCAKNDMGLNDAATAAILANVDQECTFRVTSSYMETNGNTSYGLAQWNGNRRNNLIKYCNNNGLDYKTTEGQMQFLEYELKTSYPAVYEKLTTVENTPEGAYEAASYYCKVYEVPANASKKADQRGNWAKEYFNDLTT